MYKLIITYSLINCPAEYEELFLEALTTEGFTKIMRCYQFDTQTYREKSCIAPAGQLIGQFYFDAFRTQQYLAEFIYHNLPLQAPQKITYTVAHVNEIVAAGLEELPLESSPDNSGAIRV